jgi:predicted cytidylate kinase
MRITISGPIGSGKTTVCAALSKRLGIEHIVSGLSLTEFGKLAESDPRYDRTLDERMVELAKEKTDIVLEGRLTAYMLTQNGIPALRVFLDAPIDVRVSRVVEREGGDLAHAKVEMIERERSEATRYKQYYDIDIIDRSVYDLIIDTGQLTPEQIVDMIVHAMRERDA